MAAEYALSRGVWAGPRKGVNWVGFAAWAVGFAFGISDKLPGIPAETAELLRPATLIAFCAAFLSYAGLALLGLRAPLFVKHVQEAAPEPELLRATPDASAG